MPISNTNPNPKDVVILQRDDTNAQYNETHISASGVILHINQSGYVDVDNSASFYTLYPPPSTQQSSTASYLSGSVATASFLFGTASWASNVTSASWASASLTSSLSYTASYINYSVVADDTTRDNIPLDPRYIGFVTYVIADNQFYQLIGGTNNAHWVAVPISASFAENSFYAVTASWAANGGGGGGTVTLLGSNNYVPTWWNNALTTGSLIYTTNYNIGINTPYPSANDTLTVTELSGSEILWTPTLLNIPARFWYKADSITLVSASFVDWWPDASPYQNNATASGPTTKPQLIYNQLNGWPVVRFDGVNDGLHCLTPSSVTASVVTAFVVAKVASYSDSVTPTNIGTIIGNGHAGNSKDFLIGEYYDEISNFYWTVYSEDTLGGYSQNTPISGKALTNLWYINTVIINGGASSTTLYLSGSVSGSGNAAQSTNLDLRDLYIGYETSANQPFQGDIAEIIILTQSLSTSDQQKIEGYLAWKYGLQSNLTGSHPYSKTMPTPGGGGNIQVWKDFNNNTLAFLSSSGILYVTASYALTSSFASASLSASSAISASYATNASQSINSISASWAPPIASDYSVSASWASASFVSNTSISSSWASQSFSASFAVSASWAPGGSSGTSASSSWASQSLSSSYASTASIAITAVSSSNSLTSSYFYSQSGSGAWRIYVNNTTGDLTFAFF